MRRSRPPRPKERKTGNQQYPRGNPPPHGRPPNASPWASETAVNPAARTTLRRPNKGAPRSGWKNPDQNPETRRTGELPDRREEAIGDRKRRPSHLTPGENPAKVEELSTSATPEGRGGRRRAPDWRSSTLAEDRDAPGRGERSKSQEEQPVCAPSSACLEREGEVSARSSSDESVEERQRLPRRREELTEEGDPPLERSKHVHRSHHQTTDCNAHEGGTRPDAAGHQTRQDQQREQQAKTPAPAGVTVAAQKVAAPAAVEDGHATPPDAAAEAVTPAKTPGAPREEEPDKPMKN